MSFLRWAIVSLFVTLLGCTSTVMLQHYQLGKKEFNDGNFRAAFCQLLPVAVYGKVEAQYAVGYLYYYGYGVPRDPDSGLFWMNKAADRCYPPAVHALALIHRGPVVCENIESSVTLHPIGAYKDVALPAEMPIHSTTHTTTYRTEPALARPVFVKPGLREHITHTSITRTSIEKPVVRNSSVTEERVITNTSITPNKRIIRHEAPLTERPLLRRRESSVSPKSVIRLRESSSSPRALIRPSENSLYPRTQIQSRERPLYPKSVAYSQHTSISQNTQSNYALQLYGAFKLEHVKNLQTQLNAKEKTQIWHAKNQNRDWYVLTYGRYPSIADARLARDELPPSLTNLDPWVRNISSLDAVG